MLERVSPMRCAARASSTPRSPSTPRSSRSIRRRATPASVGPWRSFDCVATPRRGQCSKRRRARASRTTRSRACAGAPARVGSRRCGARRAACAGASSSRSKRRPRPVLTLVETTAMALAENGRFSGRDRSTASGDRDRRREARRTDLAIRSDGESPPLRVQHALTSAVGGRRSGALSASRAALIVSSSDTI